MQAEYEDLLLKFETQVDFSCLTDCMRLLHIFAPSDNVITIFQGITKDIQIECLAKKLAEAECNPERTTSTSTCHLSECVTRGGKALTSRESEAILVIKQLQDQVIIISTCCLCLLSSDTYGYVNFQQIKELETEKSSIQGNLDNVVQLATKQNSSSRVKYDQVIMDFITSVSFSFTIPITTQ